MNTPKTEKTGQVAKVPKRDPNKLTKKEALFCNYYVTSWNATKAAFNAGYSKHSAYAIGAENLKKPRVIKRIEKILSERMSSTKITHERILNELATIAFAKMPQVAEIRNGQMKLIDTDNLSDEVAGAIKTYSETITRDGGSQSVTLYDKLDALRLLAKYSGLDGLETKVSSLEELLLTAIEKKAES